MKKELPHEIVKKMGDGSFSETRGLLNVTILGGDCEAPDSSLRHYAELTEAARQLIAQAGEPSIESVIADAGDQVVDALRRWAGKIGARHGLLSPVCLGAQFLAIVRVTAADLAGDKGNVDKLKQVIALCDAWHWFHMEVYGEHARAFDGARTRANLAAAGTDRAKKKQEREAIIEPWCVEHWKCEPMKAGPTARALFVRINEALKSKNLKLYTNERSLELVIGEIIQRRASQ